MHINTYVHLHTCIGRGFDSFALQSGILFHTFLHLDFLSDIL